MLIIIHMHHSVLLQEVLDSFKNRPLSLFVDGTLGAGGHSEAILQAHPEITQFIGFDQDPQALGISQERLSPFKDKLTLIHSNFSKLSEFVKEADGILVDLGVSSMQFDQGEKGFSFMRDGPLDMRMNPHEPLTAKVIVNEWDEAAIGRIFRDYGEEKKWRRAAYAIILARKVRSIDTTAELVAVLEPVLRDPRLKINPVTKVFQALRIAVNRELDVLETFLVQALAALRPGGRLAVISFHSLEDRIVKHFFRNAASDKVSTIGLGGGLFLDKDPQGILVTNKPIEAGEQEVRANPRSRSAKLRVFQKV